MKTKHAILPNQKCFAKHYMIFYMRRVKKMTKPKCDNTYTFIEVEEVEEANGMETNLWRFIGLKDGKFVFMKRMRELK